MANLFGDTARPHCFYRPLLRTSRHLCAAAFARRRLRKLLSCMRRFGAPQTPLSGDALRKQFRSDALERHVRARQPHICWRRPCDHTASDKRSQPMLETNGWWCGTGGGGCAGGPACPCPCPRKGTPGSRPHRDGYQGVEPRVRSTEASCTGAPRDARARLARASRSRSMRR